MKNPTFWGSVRAFGAPVIIILGWALKRFTQRTETPQKVSSEENIDGRLAATPKDLAQRPKQRIFARRKQQIRTTNDVPLHPKRQSLMRTSMDKLRRWLDDPATERPTPREMSQPAGSTAWFMRFRQNRRCKDHVRTSLDITKERVTKGLDRAETSPAGTGRIELRLTASPDFVGAEAEAEARISERCAIYGTAFGGWSRGISHTKGRVWRAVGGIRARW